MTYLILNKVNDLQLETLMNFFEMNFFPGRY